MAILIGHILSNSWAIHPAYVHANIQTLVNLVDGKLNDTDFSQARAELKPYALNLQSRASSPIAQSGPGSIAVINLSGPLMKRDQFCGPEGTASIGNHIKEADGNPNISAIILKIDSPGGTVDGTETLANIIANTKKPVIGFVDGMMASAAMWIGSACNEIIASGNTDIIGSIGTMIGFADMKPALESAGIKFHEILASDSFNKNLEIREALKGNYTPMQENVLNPTNRVFTAAIKTNRAGKLDRDNEDVLTGKIYNSKQAIKVGLIDSIGDFDFAVKRATELAKTTATNSLPDMKITIKSAWTALQNLLSLSATANTDVQHELTEAQLEAINTKVSEHAALTAQVGTLTAANTTATADIAALKAEIATLKVAPVGGPSSTTVKVEEEKQVEKKPTELKSWEKAAAALPNLD